jgi:UDP-N-acetylglucosamine 4,6-dehydratase
MIYYSNMTEINACCPKTSELKEERILIFGGSGSLGTSSIQRWIHTNTIINVSRDEEKQWQLRSKMNSPHLTQIIGDIANEEDVEQAILTTQPTIICIFACLKHIDLCEKFPKKSLAINSHGIMNVHQTLLKFKTTVHTVLFVSTDKACLPITTYGCSKAIAENFLQGIRFQGVKWVGVRYGNVLYSSGSIIPYLIQQSTKEGCYTLTHSEMTRFIMTLDQSVNLIEHAIAHGKHNEIIIPQIYSMKIKELFELFEERYHKNTVEIGLRCKEKIHEDLISDFEAKMAYQLGHYFHIGTIVINSTIKAFDSSMNVITKVELESYLEGKGFLT